MKKRKPFSLTDLIPGIQVVSDEEAEKVDYVICCTADMKSPFKDNVRARCALCDRAIIHRPHVPKTPPKICLYCASRIAEESKVIN